jgi:hypothetical protein
MSSPESVPSTVIVVLAGSSAVIIRTISHYLSRARSCRLGTKPNNASITQVRLHLRCIDCAWSAPLPATGHLLPRSFLDIFCDAPWPMCRWTADAVARAATKSPSRAQTRQKSREKLGRRRA